MHAGVGLPGAGEKARPRKRVLVTGATGGVGTMAVQLARWAGCEVVVLCSKLLAAFAEELGAEEVVVYDGEPDWAARLRENGSVDVVVDAAGGAVLEGAFGCVKDGGVVVSIATPPAKELVEREGKRGVRGLFFVVEPNGEVLGRIGEVVERKALVGVVREVVGLKEAGEVGVEVGVRGRRGRGKVVVRIWEGEG